MNDIPECFTLTKEYIDSRWVKIRELSILVDNICSTYNIIPFHNLNAKLSGLNHRI